MKKVLKVLAILVAVTFLLGQGVCFSMTPEEYDSTIPPEGTYKGAPEPVNPTAYYSIPPKDLYPFDPLLPEPPLAPLEPVPPPIGEGTTIEGILELLELGEEADPDAVVSPVELYDPTDVPIGEGTTIEGILELLELGEEADPDVL